ncbi:uncharacterized protein FA14DRAFT_161498 [Meira miltonrushii]|uniref:BTB domain-containing protein n=1 Tax=Meira miltonrushii TaxID=1280837 RepID=A0A316V9C4_9BASI|nr:uncharacterized protein FA14DRAFT_161498 [Meira miltonrushii]PWN33844.1 hypothetical protein FA14DRAFT_161498 [Meira miltonrushii]
MAPIRNAGQSKARTSTLSQKLPELQPNSTLACQVQATNAWRRDLRSLLNHASDRFADVCWTFKPEDVEENDDMAESSSGHINFAALHRSQTPPSSVSHGSIFEETTTIWAHKALLYARASNSFQARYLQLRTPADNLGAIASSSTISLPVVRAPSPTRSTVSRRSSRSVASKRKTVRGPAPPSSFRASANPSVVAESDTEDEGDRSIHRRRSNSSVDSFHIGRPLSRRNLQPNSSSSSAYGSSTTEDDALSVISGTSTVRAPMNLSDISPAFFEATLEYLYTAEESVVEVFEFLFEDRVGPQDGVEKRLDKLRQDLVFMWRSRLYSDIEIVLGQDHVKNIPDAQASVLSLNIDDATDEEEIASFSAHRMILASRSPYFASLLLSPYADTNNRVVSLPSPPFTPAAMHFTLGFIYTGTLFFSNRTFDLSTAFQLWLAGSYLQIETLQSLISSLIAQDFCHGFSCSPPCKTCTKRVPRTLSFVSRPDVNDLHLHSLAQSAITGEHFGTYWSKEVGNLDYAVRGSLVSELCAKIDRQPGFIVTTLRQLAIVGARIDVERSTSWVESLRWMCEAVQGHISTVMSESFQDVVCSKEWRDLVDGVGFMNDVLETALTVFLDNIEERTAARNYEVLVGQVLLSEERVPSSDVVMLAEEARNSLIQYIRKRWVNIRSVGGFNDLKRWSLKEISDEIDVSAEDLLLPEEDAGKAARKTVRAVPGRANMQANDGLEKIGRMPAPGSIVDGEREAGPIHLRAAVLNRNAARVSASQGLRASPAQSPSSPSSRTSSITAASSPRSIVSSDERASSQIPPNRQPPPANTASPSLPASRLANRVTERPQHHSSPVATSRTSTTQARATTTTKVSSPSTSRLTSNNTVRSSIASPSDRARKVSAQSAKSISSVATTSGLNREKNATPVRSRVPSTASAISTITLEGQASTPTKRTAKTTGSLVASRIAAMNSKGVVGDQTPAVKKKNEPIGRTVLKERNLPAKEDPDDTIMLDSAPVAQIQKNADKQQSSQFDGIGTKLSFGIPCVIAPTTRNGKVTRIRATVKYIGPVMDAHHSGQPMIGVEVALPLPAGVDENSFDFHDGTYQGHEYYSIGLSSSSSSQDDLRHKPEREARMRRLEAILARPNEDISMNVAEDGDMTVGGDKTVSVSGTYSPLAPSAKRRKDISGIGKSIDEESSSTKVRGLFIRPKDVLWVVV